MVTCFLVKKIVVVLAIIKVLSKINGLMQKATLALSNARDV